MRKTRVWLTPTARAIVGPGRIEDLRIDGDGAIRFSIEGDVANVSSPEHGLYYSFDVRTLQVWSGSSNSVGDDTYPKRIAAPWSWGWIIARLGLKR